MSALKQVVIIAGPNGAGKTTFAREFLFLALSHPDEAVARVATRVQQGGHDVPEQVIRRRFAAGMRNFLAIYRHRVDHWTWFDNSGPVPRLLEEGTNR